MFILNSIAPLFLLIGLGKVLRKTGFFPDTFFKGLNKLVFWIALPCLLIAGISKAELELSTVSKLVLALLITSILSLFLAWGCSRIMKLSDFQAGSFIQGAFRGNGAFIGLPVIIYTMGDLDPQAEMLGTVMLAFLVVIFNVLSVIVLTHFGNGKKSGMEAFTTILTGLIKNPLIIACMLGLALNGLDVAVPVFIARALEALGRAALPLILLSIGASLSLERLKGAASPSLVAALIKTIVTPLIGVIVLSFFDLKTTERMILIFYLAAPAAGASYVMADIMGCDARLAGRIIALSTLLCGITLPIIIALGL